MLMNYLPGKFRIFYLEANQSLPPFGWAINALAKSNPKESYFLAQSKSSLSSPMISVPYTHRDSIYYQMIFPIKTNPVEY